MLFYYLLGIVFIFYSLNMFYLSLIMMINKFNLFIEWNFFFLNSMDLNMYIYLDWMSLMFIFTVLLISSMIMFYCIEYMSHDYNLYRFFFMLSFFILSMLLMIISPNMFSILIGWDGLGLTSYCLVIYYNSKSSYNSGMLVFMMNRIGDVMIILSCSMMFMLGSLNFLNYDMMNFYILLFVMIASFTKSAQFPFSSWLPAAMAAPTPVSSLVHSSTLVTAGVYLLIRFNKIMYLNLNIMNYIMISGLITMFIAGLCANFEFDLKKIIAYSTLSQLGLMMMIYGSFNYELSFFHLIIHAMFKSMMFMCSGIMIHNLLDYQDIRYLGKIKDFMPMTTMMFLISNFSLCGLPFMSGFYSKDQILEILFMMNSNLFIYILLLLSTGLTVMYSFRLFYYLMVSFFKFIPMNMIYDNKKMNYSMYILMFFSIKFGIILNWFLYNNIEVIFLFNLEKWIILIFCFIFLLISLFMFKLMILINNFYFLKNFLGKMCFLYKFNYLLIINNLNFGKFYFMVSDKGWSEYFLKKFVYNNMKYMNLFNLMNLNYLMIMMMLLNYLILLFLLFY